MKIQYDEKVDALSVRFSNAEVETSDEEKPGFILDYDKNGSIVAVEILDVSDRKIDTSKIDLKIGPTILKMDINLGSTILALDRPNLGIEEAAGTKESA